MFTISPRPILHKYANEDVSLGAWFIGLDVEHIDDRDMCCGTPPGQFLQLFCMHVARFLKLMLSETVSQTASGRRKQGTSVSHHSIGNAVESAIRLKG